jgi:hypothetical protein
LKLGLFVDAAFRSEGGRTWSGSELLGFAIFAASVGEKFDRFLLISRGTADSSATPFPLPGAVEHVPLPLYPSLKHIGAVMRAAPGTVRAIWRALADVDLV